MTEEKILKKLKRAEEQHYSLLYLNMVPPLMATNRFGDYTLNTEAISLYYLALDQAARNICEYKVLYWLKTGKFL